MAEVLDWAGLIKSLASMDAESLSYDELKEAVLGSQQALNAMNALSAALLERFDRSGTWADDGSRSAAGWAASRTGSPKRDLKAQLRAGRAMRRLASVAIPAREGRLSADHLGTLARAERQHPELAARDEELLVEQAMDLDAEGHRRAVDHWCDLAENVDDPDPEPRPEPPDELHLWDLLDGRLELRGTFGAESAAVIRAALQGVVAQLLRAAGAGDPSVGLTGPQLHAHALVDLLAQAMRSEPGDDSVPDRYRIGLVMRADRLDDVGVAGCDSLLYRILIGAKGEVLDIGRKTRQWSHGIRRAITYRDAHCVFPGCDRPPGWCDLHHCQRWEDDGSTKVGNGALLCRGHHSFIHAKRWRVDIEDGRAVVYRDDGARHVITRWSAE